MYRLVYRSSEHSAIQTYDTFFYRSFEPVNVESQLLLSLQGSMPATLTYVAFSYRSNEQADYLDLFSLSLREKHF